MDKKSLSHTAWKCQYHIVFIPKYRKKALFGQLRTDIVVNGVFYSISRLAHLISLDKS